MTAARTILVVDDEPTITDIVARYLRREGYVAVTASDGQEAVAADEAHRPDLVVLDLMLPGLDGLGVMAHLRQRRPVPVIMLTARGEEPDRLLGLRLGADDYLVKPFSPAELVARIAAVLRRSGDGAAAGTPAQITFGEVEIDVPARSVRVAGDVVALTPREFDLLHHLARIPGRVFSRAELMEAVWRNPVYSDTSTVTVHVRRLRQKIERDPLDPRHLQTVWGVGYRLMAS